MKFDKKKLIRILLVAVIIFASSSFMAFILTPKTPQVESVVLNEIKEKEKVKILVASSTLVRGDIINIENAYWMEIEESAYEPFSNQYIKEDSERAENIFNGKFIITNRLEGGEPISFSKISELGNGGALSSFITKGKRAVSLRLEHQNAGGGFILPNDIVDIFFAKKGSSYANSSPSEKKSTSKFLIKKAKVIGINQQFDVNGEKTLLSNMITLEVTPEEAQKLLAAQVEGEITLLLRAVNDDEDFQIEIEEEKPKEIVVTKQKEAKIFRFGGNPSNGNAQE